MRSEAGDLKGQIELLELHPDEQVVWRFKSGPEEWLRTDGVSL